MKIGPRTMQALEYSLLGVGVLTLIKTAFDVFNVQVESLSFTIQERFIRGDILSGKDTLEVLIKPYLNGKWLEPFTYNFDFFEESRKLANPDYPLGSRTFDLTSALNSYANEYLGIAREATVSALSFAGSYIVSKVRNYFKRNER